MDFCGICDYRGISVTATDTGAVQATGEAGWYRRHWKRIPRLIRGGFHEWPDSADGGPDDAQTQVSFGVGAAWVFDRIFGKWVQTIKLVGQDATGAAQQGFSVALSDAGTNAVVGGPFDNQAKGAAWIFVRRLGRWQEQAKLVPNIAMPFDLSGHSTAISGDGKTVLIGVPELNGGVGGTFVFVEQYGKWIQQNDLRLL